MSTTTKQFFSAAVSLDNDLEFWLVDAWLTASFPSPIRHDLATSFVFAYRYNKIALVDIHNKVMTYFVIIKRRQRLIFSWKNLVEHVTPTKLWRKSGKLSVAGRTKGEDG